jgi:hypothetical protein
MPEEDKDLATISKQKEKNGPKSLEEVTKLYLIPLLMVIITILLLFFLVLPQVNGLTDTLSLINAEQEEYTRLREIEQNRSNLAQITNQQQADLAKIDSIIPQSQTAVVDFSESIREKARQNRLVVNESVVGEIVTATPRGISGGGAGGNQPGLELVELPSEFSLSGRFNNIQGFLSDIFGGEDFIVIKEMTLNRRVVNQEEAGDTSFSQSNTDNWSLNLVLVKYQFRLAPTASEEDLQRSYFSVPENLRPNQEVLEFINENY